MFKCLKIKMERYIKMEKNKVYIILDRFSKFQSQVDP